jgi:hypothetical protein
MNKILWTLRVPATGIIRGPYFASLPGRRCDLSYSIEADDGSEVWLALRFQGVQAFKATFLGALGAIEEELRSQAYGALVSIEDSPWIAQIRKTNREYVGESSITIKHFIICYDDGPCYEFVCERFEELQLRSAPRLP